MSDFSINDVSEEVWNAARGAAIRIIERKGKIPPMENVIAEAMAGLVAESENLSNLQNRALCEVFEFFREHGIPYEDDNLIGIWNGLRELHRRLSLPSVDRCKRCGLAKCSCAPQYILVDGLPVSIDPDPAGANDPEATEILYKARGLDAKSIRPTTDDDLDNLPY